MPREIGLDLGEQPEEEGAAEVESIEAAGVVIDSEGHKWVIPAENVDDYDDLNSTNPFGKLTFDDRFDYHTEHQDRVAQKMTEGFVPCTRKEMGMPPAFEIDGARPTTPLVHVMDTVMLKIPKELAARRRRAKVRIAQEQVAGTEPSDEMLARAKRNNSSKIKDSRAALDRLRNEGNPLEVEKITSIRDEPRESDFRRS